MNLKKNLRAFFTLTRKANDAFTLVELIVVIAIMAILSGVAVPAYSGYIAKADKAADEQLLASLNTAFAAACVINGEDNYNRDDVSDITIGEDGLIEGSFIGDEAVAASFVELYEVGKFKAMTELYYNKLTGSFAENESLTFTFGDQQITLSEKDFATLSGDNAFSDRGSEELLNDIGVLENLLDTGIGEDVLNSVKQSDEFLWALGGYAGMKQGEDEADDDYLDKVAGYMMDTNNKDAVYSAQIMFAASNAANATEEQISDLFTGTVTSNIEAKNSDGTTDYTQTMANAALAYGMYTAYKQQNPNAEGVDNFTNTVNSDAFAKYYASEQGQSDLAAYQAAMNMVSDNTSNSEITSSILENGIKGNADLEALMKEVMGN